MAIIAVSDFVGRYNLVKDVYSTQLIGDYIVKFEKKYLYQLLGVELAELLIADISGGVPSSPEYAKIFNPLYFNDSCDNLYHSDGIKSLLLGLVYWHYTIEGRLTPSITGGTSQNEVEVGKIALSRSEIFARYNDSVDYAKCIQRYILENSSDYPTFKGNKFTYNY